MANRNEDEVLNAADQETTSPTSDAVVLDKEEITSSETEPEPKLPSLSVRDRLLMSIDILHQGSWIAMGLVADPASGQIKRELEQARIAIDCVGYLAAKVEPDLDDHTRRELKNLVSDLQINFVQQSSH